MRHSKTAVTAKTAKTAKKMGWMQGLAAGALALGLAAPQFASANHPVKVEGDLDADGDGRTGQQEDTDGPAGDPQGLTFGTLAGCLGNLNGGINQNGVCLIVTSGSFAETVNITNQVTIEAAPGVSANIEAFLVPADPRLAQFPARMDPNAAQSQPGIVINSPANRQVVLRNLTITNWTDGVQIMGNSHVLLDNVRIDHNINNGINVMSRTAVVTVTRSQITSTGFRLNPMTGDFPGGMAPNPGIGINSVSGATVMVADSILTGNFGVASANVSGVNRANRNTLSDNNRSANLPRPGTITPPPQAR
jgi:hypothetical protein